MKNELVSLGNKADQMEERISDIEDRNLEMTQGEEERESRVRTKMKELYENYLTQLKRAI